MPDNGAQRRSSSYKLAFEDPEFLLRAEMRPFRFGMEFAKAELSLHDWGIRSTVVVFGSARIPSRDTAEREMAAAKTAAERKAAQRQLNRSAWYEHAREFARVVSLRGGALAPPSTQRDNVIATGGGPGIMEAANRGAAEVGAPSIGFNVTLPSEQVPNAYSTPGLTFQFHYFAMRKMHLAMRANALAIFPGGFGTFDEFFEILTLVQTKKAPVVPIVLFGRDYWQEVVNFPALVRHGMVEERDLSLFEMVDDPEEGWAALVRRGLKAHTPPQESPKDPAKPPPRAQPARKRARRAP